MDRRLSIFVIILFFLLLTAVQAQATGSFRFAQLTDIHLSPNSPEPAEDLKHSIEQINTTLGIDFVLVTGDLTEEGDRVAMLLVRSILDQLKVKYYVTLGNHETRWSDSGCTAFSDIFRGERFEFEHKGFLFLGFNSGPLMRVAYEHVVPQDITQMKQEMDKAGKDKPVILVTHCPMLDGDVDSWYDVTDAVRSYNIRTFIGGHYHRNRLLSYDGIPGILTRSNLWDKDGIGGYGMFDVTPDSIITYEQRIGEPMERWAALSLTKPYYDRSEKTVKYLSFAVNEEYPQVKADQLVQTGAGIYCSPAIWKNKVYVGDDLGFLTCYTLKSEQKLWNFQSGKRIVGTPDIADGVVVFGSADHNIYGLNARAGRECWRVTVGEPVLGAVTIEKGVAHIGTSDSTFRAIHIKGRKVLWSYAGIKGYVETKPLIEEDKVIFGAWDNTLYTLDKTNGKELWRWTGELTRMHFSPAAVWPVAAHKKVFITNPQRATTAINLETGETAWRTFQSMVREAIGLSTDKKRIYSKTMSDNVVCYSTIGDIPKRLWASNVGFGYEHAPSMQMEKDGVAFSSTKERLIFALETSTGQMLQKHKIGNSLINTVIPVSRHQVLFTAAGDEVGRLNCSLLP